jgi:hypothetical protein
MPKKSNNSITAAQNNKYKHDNLSVCKAYPKIFLNLPNF